MKKLSIFHAICVLIAAAFILNFCTYYGSIYFDWRQKITVVVQTPEGQVKGFAVQQVIVEKARHKLGHGGADFRAKLTGEAVIIELPEDKKLFLLLKDIESLLPRMLSPKKGWGSKEALSKAAAQPQKTLLTIPLLSYPLLVTFTDIDAPKSVKKVDPDDLAASFGSGYALKSITLEITDELATKGAVEAVLGWFERVKGRIKPYDGPTRNLADVPDVELLTKLDFVRK